MAKNIDLGTAFVLGSAIVGATVGYHYFNSNAKSGVGGAVLGAGLSIAAFYAIVQGAKVAGRKILKNNEPETESTTVTAANFLSIPEGGIQLTKKPNNLI